MSFKSPAFGVTYKTVDNEGKRKFQIEVFETKPNTECKVEIDEENEHKVMEYKSEDFKNEIVGIVFNHEENIADLDSQGAVERFRNNLNEILL